jgi:hypothetical protein
MPKLFFDEPASTLLSLELPFGCLDIAGNPNQPGFRIRLGDPHRDCLDRFASFPPLKKTVGITPFSIMSAPHRNATAHPTGSLIAFMSAAFRWTPFNAATTSILRFSAPSARGPQSQIALAVPVLTLSSKNLRCRTRQAAPISQTDRDLAQSGSIHHCSAMPLSKLVIPKS